MKNACDATHVDGMQAANKGAHQFTSADAVT